jgi:hypothetical protein
VKTFCKASHPLFIAAGERNLAADQNQQFQIALSSEDKTKVSTFLRSTRKPV